MMVTSSTAHVNDIKHPDVIAAIRKMAANYDKPPYNTGGRLPKAMDLVLAGKVTLGEAGAAVVKSGNQTYTLSPECCCEDSQRRSMWCKHKTAVCILRNAHDSRRGHPEPPVAMESQDPFEGLVPEPLPEDLTEEEPPPLDWEPPATEVGRNNPPLPTAPASPVTPTGEVFAPSTVCLKARLAGGIEISWTLRGADHEMPGRIKTALADLEQLGQQQPPPAPPQAPPAEPPVQPPGGAEHFCKAHNTWFKHQQNEHGEWWSHKAPDGTWCKFRNGNGK